MRIERPAVIDATDDVLEAVLGRLDSRQTDQLPAALQQLLTS